MGKLCILSEIDCLDHIKIMGIKPKYFTTSINEFREDISFESDAVVVIILSSRGRFTTRVILELIQLLKIRMEDENDNGVSAIYLLTDTTLPMCRNYYFFKNNMFRMSLFSNNKCKDENIDFWGNLSYEHSDLPCEVALSNNPYDSTGVTDTEKKLKISEEYMVNMIKVPKL